MVRAGSPKAPAYWSCLEMAITLARGADDAPPLRSVDHISRLPRGQTLESSKGLPTTFYAPKPLNLSRRIRA